jgi:hypothetical protein
MTTRTKPPRIHPQLQPLAIPIDSVELNPRNPRQGDLGAITESLRRFGQAKPIVVQASTRHVVAGNHMLRAALSLGWKEIAANVVELDGREAQAFMIADNRTSDLGSYDEGVLTELLKELAVDDDLEGTGFDGDDVDEMLAKLGWKASGGSTVVQYVLIFDSEAQQDVWTAWLKALRKRYADRPEDTHAARIVRAIAELTLAEAAS